MFTNQPANKLRIAKRTPDDVWSVEPVDNAPGLLGNASVAVDSHGERHLTYAYGRIRYSEKTELRHTRSDANAVGRVVRVPVDYATIQAAIDAVDTPDTVRVSPGTYGGIIDFRGKALVVQSSNGPDVTILDGLQQDGVVVFSSGEGPESVLEGFMVRNGARGPTTDGSGIQMQASSPTIRGNIITENRTSSGAGIMAYSASPHILHNVFRTNHASFSGGAIQLQGTYNDSAQIVGNRFETNDAGEWGGAIYMFNGGRPRIQDNVFQDNTARGEGGAISMVNSSSPTIVQNLFVRNRSFRGGALKWGASEQEPGPIVIQNTFVDNVAEQGSAMYSTGFGSQLAVRIENNIVAAPPRTLPG